MNRELNKWFSFILKSEKEIQIKPHLYVVVYEYYGRINDDIDSLNGKLKEVDKKLSMVFKEQIGAKHQQRKLLDGKMQSLRDERKRILAKLSKIDQVRIRIEHYLNGNVDASMRDESGTKITAQTQLS